MRVELINLDDQEENFSNSRVPRTNAIVGLSRVQELMSNVDQRFACPNFVLYLKYRQLT